MSKIELANMFFMPLGMAAILALFISNLTWDSKAFKDLEKKVYQLTHNGLDESETQQITMLTSWDCGKAGE